MRYERHDLPCVKDRDISLNCLPYGCEVMWKIYVFIRRVPLRLGLRNRTYKNGGYYRPMRSTDARFTLSILAPPLKRGPWTWTNRDDRNKSYQIVLYHDFGSRLDAICYMLLRLITIWWDDHDRITLSEPSIKQQCRNIYSRGNPLIRNFKMCSDTVKCQLFQSFCTNIYCALYGQTIAKLDL
jgi:hypothetical protein